MHNFKLYHFFLNGFGLFLGVTHSRKSSTSGIMQVLNFSSSNPFKKKALARKTFMHVWTLSWSDPIIRLGYADGTAIMHSYAPLLFGQTVTNYHHNDDS